MRVIETVLPLGMEVVKDFYADKENTVFVIDYQAGELKGDAFVNYCANLELKATIAFGDTPYEEKAAIVKAVMSNPVISELQDILCEIGQILLMVRGVDFDLVPKENQLFTPHERFTFITKNPKIVCNWMVFFTSLLAYAFTILKITDDAEDIRIDLPRIKDANFVGKSVVSLLQRTSFLEAFFSIQPDSQLLYYLDVQFDEYCYKRKNLYHYFATPNNMILATALYEVFKDDARFTHSDDSGQETTGTS